MRIEFTKKAYKTYIKIPNNYKNLIKNSLLKFVNNEIVDLKPVMGEIDIYRIRVGKYRVLIQKLSDNILIVDLGTRGDIYK